MNNVHEKTTNIFLRVITLATRFLLVFFLAKYLEPAELGLYGLFVVTVGYSIYIVGMDFYTYSTREIIKTPNKSRGKLIKSQVVVSTYLYIIFFPFALVFFVSNENISHLFIWFFPLLILEHFNQEVFRILVILNEQVFASLLLFIRQGSWAIIIVVLMTLDDSTRNLNSLFTTWLIAGLVTAVISVMKINQFGIQGWKENIDWNWVKKGIKISLVLLLATLALRGIQTIDRYWLENLAGLDIVGAYILFFGIAGTLLTFMDAAVYSFSYPQLIHYHNIKNRNAFLKLIRKITIISVLISGAYGIVSFLTLPWLLNWLDNPFYTEHQYLFYWLFLAMVINVMGMIPHYGLYASGNDKHIVLSSTIALFTFIAVAFFYKNHQPILAIPIALCSAFTVIMLWKWFAFLSYNNSSQLKNEDH